tara:strand:- start:76 stop:1035 length:960 start_codon:yes stop_codon:yes gene_type:complete
MSIGKFITRKAFPEGNLQSIKTNAPNQMSYNIDATRDLVSNQPFNPFAPALAATTSLPYDTFQGIQRAFKGFEPQTGILDYDEIPDAPTFADIGKSIAAENPIDSLIGRTYGATLGLGDKLTGYAQGLKGLFDSSAMANEPTNVVSRQDLTTDFDFNTARALENRAALDRAGLMALDDAGLTTDPYETFAEKSKPGFNLGFAKQLGSTALGLITGNPFVGLITRGLGALAGRGGLTGIQGGVDLRGDTGFDTFRRSTSLADFLQRQRDKKAREAAARRGEVKELQSRIDKGDFGGNGGGGFSGEGGYGSSAERGGALHG